MLVVYKGNEVVFMTDDFKKAFDYARKLSSEGYKSFITAGSDKPLLPKPKRIPLKWGPEDEETI